MSNCTVAASLPSDPFLRQLCGITARAMRLLLRILPSICFLVLMAGCTVKSPSRGAASAHPAAKVEKVPQETEIARITLSEEAEKRLGVTVVSVISRTVAQRRMLGGEATVPLGRSILVVAPLPGTMSCKNGSPAPLPGQHVVGGDVVFQLLPLLSPERAVPTPAEEMQIANARAGIITAQTVAHGDMERSQAEVAAANIAVNRAEKLFQGGAGSARTLDDARAQFNIAKSSFDAAKAREKQLTELLYSLSRPGAAAGLARSLDIVAPQSGILRNVSVSQGQTVTAGTTLFEVIDLGVIWVRVPIYVDLLENIDITSTVRITGLDGRDSVVPAEATLIQTPPTADPLAATADLYFELDNRQKQLRPGQRVGVSLKLNEEGELKVIPNGAILFDVFGGTWVYARSEAHGYVRRRVAIKFVEGDEAFLSEGPEAGTEIVVAGAAELFGTEFGAGK